MASSTADGQSSVRFMHDESDRTLRLEHPLISARWSWDDRGRITFDRLIHKASGTSWLMETPDDPLYLLGVEGYGARFHTFDDHRPLAR